MINIKNQDNECFRYCHIRHLNPQEKNPQRIKKKDKEIIEKLDYSVIEFPISKKDHKKIEKKNEIRVNVFSYENKQPFPMHISKEDFEMELNLLLLDSDGKKHYVLIKDFNPFMFKQTKHKSKKNFCINCLQYFSNKEVLDAHRKDCIVINGKQAIKMPNEDENGVEFINHRKTNSSTIRNIGRF